MSYSRLNQVDSAAYYFNKSQKKVDFLTLTNKVNLYQNYGNFLMVHKKDLPASRSYYSKAAQLITNKFHAYHPRLKNIYVCIGDVHWRMNKMDSALYMYQKALKTIDTALELDNYSRSPEFKLAADLETLNIIMRKIRVLEILLVNLEDENLRETYYEALLVNVDYYKDAFALLLSQKLLLADQINALKGDLKNMMDIGIEAAFALYSEDHRNFYLEKALAWSEAARSLILKTTFYDLYESDSSVMVMREQAESLKRKINALYFRLNELNPGIEADSLNARIFALNYCYDSVVRAISDKAPGILQSNSMHNYDINTFKSQIPDSTLMLEYFLYRDRLHVFQMSSQGVEWYRIAFSDSLYEKVHRFIDLLNVENAHRENTKTDYLKLAASMSELFIPGGIPSDARNIIFIPDGILHYFPFELMHKAETNSISYRKMPYLIRDYNISYRYTLDRYDLPDVDKRKHVKLLVVAPQIRNHYRDSNELISPIKQAIAEADTLLEMYQGSLYTSGDKKEFSEIAPNYGALHFATHGIIDDSNPMNSHLIMSSKNDVHTDLRLAEICNLDLRAQMVVLSACETGKGDILNGEGVISLAWAFKYAGCPSVLMSLNKLEDRSTRILMISYYEYISKGYRKDEALRKAKLNYLEKAGAFKANPAYWAGLISTGEQSKVLLKKKDNFLKYLLWIAFGAIFLVAVYRIIKRRSYYRD
ncbi:MAG: CHAT domain-containing protein [Bacteroidales bacterium]|nr:CHAT domain-containing protein [Bacteroidales bacterium]MCF8387264.1 CHAT domain-containing protein [Bacteroidales bacterium]MCF8399539.1 CHAT domain-containing protein [Bacteroidales bacterium]